MQRHPSLRILRLALALGILALGFPGSQPASAQARSGLVAAEVDDGQRGEAFLAWLAANAFLAHEDLALGGRPRLAVKDGTGAPLAYLGYRLSSGGDQKAQGRTWSDGSLPLPPDANSVAYRVELSGRGGAKVLAWEAGKAPTEAVVQGARPLASPLPCDLVFVLDTTVSMAPRLGAVKQALALAMKKVAALGEGLEPRFGLVLYRDRDEAYLTKATALTADPGAINAALAGAEALGGGDIPEDLGAGLEAALDGMNWAPEGLRYVFAITDASPKIGRGQGYARACEKAVEKGVRICAVGLGNLVPEGEYALRQIGAATGAPYLAADAGWAPRPSGVGVLVKADLEETMARLVAAEARAARGGRGGSPRDPALALLDAVEAAMAKALAYPEAARLRGVSGTVGLGLRVGQDGRLLEARVASSSGSAILDRVALDLAATAFPLPNPAGGELELEIAVAYKLGD